MSLPPERLLAYSTLAQSVGNTPLVEIDGLLPNNNRLLIKQEFENHLGESHYDRVYLELFKKKEELGIIKAGMHVFETTSGTAGVSFAAIGRALGYACHVAIPAGGEKAREEAIKKAGANIYLTPEELYVNGFRKFIVQFQKEHRDYVFLNHSMGDIHGQGMGVNRISVEAMYEIADEIIQQLGSNPHHVISALGNGTNTLGLAERFAAVSPQTQVSALEMVSSGVGYKQKYGEEAYLENITGFDQKQFSRHTMPGTTYPTGIKFPALQEAVSRVPRIYLVTDERIEEEYCQKTGRGFPDSVVRFSQTATDAELATYGRSTRASIAVAQHLATQFYDQTLIVIGYDKADRYDLQPQPSLQTYRPK